MILDKKKDEYDLFIGLVEEIFDLGFCDNDCCEQFQIINVNNRYFNEIR